MSKDLSIFQLVPIDQIRSSPHQARKFFDPTLLHNLAESIRQEGLIQPITVRIVPDDGLLSDMSGTSNTLSSNSSTRLPHYELVSGERRLRAAKLLGWISIEAKVIQVISEGEAAAKGLIENLQREDLNPMEEAEGFIELNHVDAQYWTQEKISQIVGKSRSYVTQSLNLLDLPSVLQDDVRRRVYSRAHAIEIGRLPTQDLQLKVSRQIKLTGLTREKTRQFIDSLLGLREPAEVKDEKKRPRAATQQDPLAAFWPDFIANPWLGERGRLRVEYLGDFQWSFQLSSPPAVSEGVNGSALRTNLRRELGELFIRMGRSISYGETRQNFPRPAGGSPQPDRPSQAPHQLDATSHMTPAEEMDRIDLARFPNTPAEHAEVERAASEGIAALYRWIYGPDSAIARESVNLRWQDLGTPAREGAMKIIQRLRDLQSRRNKMARTQ